MFIIEPADYEKTFTRELKEYARNHAIPGFRKGTVPIDVVRQRFGKSILSTILQDLSRKALTQYIQSELAFEPFGMPVLEYTNTQELSLQKDARYSYQFVFAPAPADFKLDISAIPETVEFSIDFAEADFDRWLAEQLHLLGSREKVTKVVSGNKYRFTVEIANYYPGSLLLTSSPVTVAEENKRKLKYIFPEFQHPEITKRLIGREKTDIISGLRFKDFFADRELALYRLRIPETLFDELWEAPEIYVQLIDIEQVTPAELTPEIYQRLLGKPPEDEASLRAQLAATVPAIFERRFARDYVQSLMAALVNSQEMQLPITALYMQLVAEGRIQDPEGEMTEEKMRILQQYVAYYKEHYVIKKLLELYPQLAVSEDEIREVFINGFSAFERIALYQQPELSDEEHRDMLRIESSGYQLQMDNPPNKKEGSIDAAEREERRDQISKMVARQFEQHSELVHRLGNILFTERLANFAKTHFPYRKRVLSFNQFSHISLN